MTTLDHNHIYNADDLALFEGPFTVERSKWMRSLEKRLHALERRLAPPKGRMRERIVEYPLAIAALSRLAPNSRVADVGGASALLGLELASFGFDVDLLDLRPSPIRHPRVHVRQADLFDSTLPASHYDGIACISVIEHVGLARYGGKERPDGDIEMMAEFRRLLRPGGLLVLSAPYGHGHDPASQGRPTGYRIYNRQRLQRLLDGFDRQDLRFFHMQNGAWIRTDQSAADTVQTARPVDGIFFATLMRPH